MSMAELQRSINFQVLQSRQKGIKKKVQRLNTELSGCTGGSF